MNFSVPKEITDTINTLEKAGFEAYIVGGCVRDALLGKIPQDYDITTSATPEEVISLFSHTVPTGIKHGTVTVIFENGEKTEVTTFRCENGYSDNRHPESVSFVRNVQEDLSRRDFTVNAMAYSERSGLKDPYGGLTDLKSQILRAVGEPKLRFSEDALRILRLFRFSAQLSFEIEEKTFSGALELSGNLKNISRERIRDELIKILCSQNPSAVSPLLKTDCLAFLGIDKNCCSFEGLEKIQRDPIPRFSYFCYKNHLNELKIAQNLRFSNAFGKSCENICALLNNEPATNKVQIKRILKTVPEKDFETYLCIITHFSDTEIIWDNLKEIFDNNEPYKLSHLKINGDDLIKMGLKNKELSDTLQKLLDLVIEKPQLNSIDLLKKNVTK